MAHLHLRFGASVARVFCPTLALARSASEQSLASQAAASFGLDTQKTLLDHHSQR
jgi:hypothetical protein